MKQTRKFITAAVVVAMLLIATQHAMGQANVWTRFRIPGVVILDYWSDITVDIPSSVLAGAMFPNHSVTVGGTLGGVGRDAGAPAADISVTYSNGEFVGDAQIQAQQEAVALNNVNVTIQNFYAIRANRAGNVGIQLLTSNLTGDNGGTLTINSITPNNAAFAANGLGVSQAQYHHLTFNLNLAQATAQGLYSHSNDNPTFRILINTP